jgi:hypothetical protein
MSPVILAVSKSSAAPAASFVVARSIAYPDNGRHAGCHRRLSAAHDGSMLHVTGFEQGCPPAGASEKSIFSLTEVYNYLT